MASPAHDRKAQDAGAPGYPREQRLGTAHSPQRKRPLSMHPCPSQRDWARTGPSAATANPASDRARATTALSLASKGRRRSTAVMLCNTISSFFTKKAADAAAAPTGPSPTTAAAGGGAADTAAATTADPTGDCGQQQGQPLDQPAEGKHAVEPDPDPSGGMGEVQDESPGPSQEDFVAEAAAAQGLAAAAAPGRQAAARTTRGQRRQLHRAQLQKALNRSRRIGRGRSGPKSRRRAAADESGTGTDGDEGGEEDGDRQTCWSSQRAAADLEDVGTWAAAHEGGGGHAAGDGGPASGEPGEPGPRGAGDGHAASRRPRRAAAKRAASMFRGQLASQPDSTPDGVAAAAAQLDPDAADAGNAADAHPGDGVRGHGGGGRGAAALKREERDVADAGRAPALPAGSHGMASCRAAERAQEQQQGQQQQGQQQRPHEHEQPQCGLDEVNTAAEAEARDTATEDVAGYLITEEVEEAVVLDDEEDRMEAECSGMHGGLPVAAHDHGVHGHICCAAGAAGLHAGADGAGGAGTGGTPARSPLWDDQRPGYADLAAAVAHRAACRRAGAGAAQGLPTCWGAGLLGDSPVCCNMVLRGQAAELVQTAFAAALQGKLGRLDKRPLVSLERPNPPVLDKEVEAAVVRQLELALRRGALERMRAEGIARTGPEEVTNAEVLQYMPETIPLTDKVERAAIGVGPDPSPWDDEPAMRGQASVRVKPGCSLAPGEVVGCYSSEVWLYPEWQETLNAKPADAWDDPHRACPHRSQAARKHELGRYAADCPLPHFLLANLRKLGDPGAQLDKLRRAGIEEHGKLYGSAARLGCGVSLVNDPRRNLAARCDEEADFRAGGPNAVIVTARVLELLPVMLMVAVQPVQEKRHVMYSYGCPYWTLHQEELGHVREVEEALGREAAALAARDAAEAARRAAEADRDVAEVARRAAMAERGAALAARDAAEAREEAERCARRAAEAEAERLRGEVDRLRQELAVVQRSAGKFQLQVPAPQGNDLHAMTAETVAAVGRVAAMLRPPGSAARQAQAAAAAAAAGRERVGAETRAGAQRTSGNGAAEAGPSAGGVRSPARRPAQMPLGSLLGSPLGKRAHRDAGDACAGLGSPTARRRLDLQSTGPGSEQPPDAAAGAPTLVAAKGVSTPQQLGRPCPAAELPAVSGGKAAGAGALPAAGSGERLAAADAVLPIKDGGGGGAAASASGSDASVVTGTPAKAKLLEDTAGTPRVDGGGGRAVDAEAGGLASPVEAAGVRSCDVLQGSDAVTPGRVYGRLSTQYRRQLSPRPA